jgi:hypothetical protein
VAEIVADPELHAEAKRVYSALAVRASAAGEATVRLALQPLVLVYGVGEAARSPAFWQAYRILADLPVEALRLGVEDYPAQPDSQFFPKPGPLKALCDKHAEPIYRAAFRASKAASLEPPKARREPTEAERAQVRAMLSEFTAKVAEKAPARLRPVLPSISGKTDETGITPEMRALMERRAEGEG